MKTFIEISYRFLEKPNVCHSIYILESYGEGSSIGKDLS